MRRYDDPVEVRRGLVPGSGGQVEGPEQFLWKGRLWKVCGVVGHWVETGPWWQSPAVSVHDLAADREVWRVEAARGLAAAGGGAGGGAGSRGVFDLVFDWSEGGWLLTRCAD